MLWIMFDIFVALLLAVVLLETAALALRAVRSAQHRLLAKRLIAIARHYERERASSRPKEATTIRTVDDALDAAETSAK